MQNTDKTAILTFDLGTSGCKAMLLDKYEGIIADATAPISTILPKPLWTEQNPDDFYTAAVAAARELMTLCAERGYADAPARIAAIGLSGHMNGLTPVDKAGRPTYNHILHSDLRTSGICAELREKLDPADFFARTGNHIDPHYGMPKMLWFARECPDRDAETAHYLGSKDYLFGRLTGRFGHTDLSDASLVALLNTTTGKWDDYLCEAVGVDTAKLSELHTATELVGELSASAAADMGLPVGIPVSIGGGDGSCAALGAGCNAPGTAYCCLGSTSWVSTVTAPGTTDKKQRTFAYYTLDGKGVFITGTVQTAAIAYDWAVRNIVHEDLTREGVYEELWARMEAIPAGCDGLFFMPYFSGERSPWWDDSLRGGFVGLSQNHTADHMLRAVCEGVSLCLATNVNILRECGADFDSITLLGGAGKNRVWRRILADCCDTTLKLHTASSHATAMGAAAAAGVGAGLWSDCNEAAAALVRTGTEVTPDPKQAAFYKERRELYSLLVPALTEFYHRAAAQ